MKLENCNQKKENCNLKLENWNLILEKCNLKNVLSEGRNKCQETDGMLRDIMETNDKIENMCSELETLLETFGRNLGLKTEDIVDILDEHQLIQFILQGEKRQMKRKLIEKTILGTDYLLHDICLGMYNKKN